MSTPTSSSAGGSSLPSGAVAAAVGLAKALYVDKNVTEATRLFPKLDAQRAGQLHRALVGVITHLSGTSYQVGQPTGDQYSLTVPVRDVTDGGRRLSASVKLTVEVNQTGGKWVAAGFYPKDWDASGSGGKNPPFRCTPGFVTTLRGVPLAALLRPFPAPNLVPEPSSVAGADVARNVRGFGSSILFDHQSTGLPAGPSRAMFDCYVKYVVRHGWRRDRYTDRERGSRDGPSANFYVSRTSGKAMSITWSKDELAPGKYELSLFVSLKGYLPPPPR